MNTDPEDLRRYLLGQLPEEEAERMEAQLLSDDEVSELAESVEEELLIEYFRGELPEGRDLVGHLSASAAGRQRVELARALAAAMPKVRPFWKRPALLAAMAGSMAAALAVVVIGLPVQKPPAPQPPQIASTQEVEPPPARITLPLSGTRGGGESLPPLDLRPEQTRAELKLPLGGETCPSCQVSLRREDGSQVPQHWKIDQGNLVVLVRAADLPNGVYGVRVQRVLEGEPDLLGDVQFKVSRSKSK